MLYDVREDIQYERDAEKFDKYMTEILSKQERFKVSQAYFFAKKFMYKASILMALSNFSQLGFPIILKQFIKWLLDEDDTSYWGYIWILALCLIMVVKTVLLRTSVLNMHRSRNTLGNRFAVSFVIQGTFLISILGVYR